MKIILAGGTGQVGTLLTRAFLRDGHEIVILSRKPGSIGSTNSTNPTSSANNIRTILWDARTPGPWTQELNNADVVINLAGRSVNCRYNPRNRQLITDSRVDSTHAIGRAIAASANPPRIWLQASTATIYAHRFDAPNDEFTGIIGGSEPNAPDTWRFSIRVAKTWEQAVADTGPLPHTRTVLLRSAITMNPDPGSAFSVLSRLVRLGLGGRAGNGRQFVSWIHETDFVRAIYWLIEHDTFTGPVNLAAPNPLPNADFMRALRKAWRIPIGLPATNWMLELGAIALRTETELILKSRRVISARLPTSGFTFQFPSWPEAAQDLVARFQNTLSKPK